MSVGVAALVPVGASAQEHGGHESGSDHSHEDHGGQGQKGGKGRAPGEASAGGHRGMEDIFRDIGSADEDSDRPSWAGEKGGKNEHGGQPGSAGSTRGDLYGDLYVILRDDDGVPILNEDGFVQPIDAEGNPIPLDDEGAPIDLSLVQEVEMGRLNVGRAPTSVLIQRADEVVALLSTATAITTDAAGRLVVTNPDGTTKTIDAPLENLALYVALMTEGTIPGVTDLPGTDFDFLVDGELTPEDMAVATSLLAGASDKFETLSPDAVAYINAILDINDTTVGDVTYSDVDYSTYNYDRSDTYGDVTTTVLIKQDDGSWLPTEVNIYDAVFGNEDYSGTGTFTAFATAVDDARTVINYIHEYAVPADTPAEAEE
ncbi:hypothetical protein [Novosphingobium malaysiense]|nr:hypothetical protein [Novosphingobium malaysiense]